MDEACIRCELGYIIIRGDNSGVMHIHISDSGVESDDIPPSLSRCVQELQAYFAGELKSFGFSVNPKGTDFQKKVWELLVQIPFGETCSYLELANRLGDPRAVRAVAAANGKNPLWVVFPCHRVVGSDGSLTGYAGGLWRKKWLLEFERPSLQQSFF